jgi:glycosyltransferase involved in cell wall biosynthesis
MSKLKILFITADTYPPYRPAARAIFWDELVKRDYTIDWVLQSEQPCKKPYTLVHGKGTVFIASSNNGSRKWNRIAKNWQNLRNDIKIFKLAHKKKYDIIQVKDKYLIALIAIFIARLTGTRFVYWLAYPHAEADIYAAKNKVARYPFIYYIRGVILKFLLYKIILPFSDHIFVQSEQMKKDIEARGVSTKKMTPIPGSVNLDVIPFDDINFFETQKEKNKKDIVYLGTLIRERNLDFLVRVIKEVLKYEKKAKLILIGAGENPEDEEFLLREAELQKVEHAIVFTGYLPMSEAWEYIRRASVCVSPYFPTPILLSTSPTKLIEYMAMGIAVVGNNHPEQSLVITESQGGLCTSWNEAEFANAIVYLLNNSEVAREMGIKGRTYVEKFRTNSIMANTVINEYNKLCKKN